MGPRHCQSQLRKACNDQLWQGVLADALEDRRLGAGVPRPRKCWVARAGYMHARGMHLRTASCRPWM